MGEEESQVGYRLETKGWLRLACEDCSYLMSMRVHSGRCPCGCHATDGYFYGDVASSSSDNSKVTDEGKGSKETQEDQDNWNG